MRLRVLLVLLTLVASVVPAAAAGAATDPVVADGAWILGAQLPDGAIANYVDRAAIWPYLANLAAMGLARSTEVTGDARYATAAWRWLGWYQAHQASTGFVTDYVVTSHGPVSTGDMDSTDAYSGTFLLAAWRTWKATGNLARLVSLRAGLALAVTAIEATQDSDGLTWAKPAWHVKYLMDQAETYAGLRAEAEMAGALGDSLLASRATFDAGRQAAGVDRLWNPATGAYDWAVMSSGAHQSTNWSLFYPDSLEQVWAVAFGLATGARAGALVGHFDSAHPTWDQPVSTELFPGGPAPVGYWPVVGLAMARVGQGPRASVAGTRIEAAMTAAGRAWPVTPGVTGSLIELESADGSYLPAMRPS